MDSIITWAVQKENGCDNDVQKALGEGVGDCDIYRKTDLYNVKKEKFLPKKKKVWNKITFRLQELTKLQKDQFLKKSIHSIIVNYYLHLVLWFQFQLFLVVQENRSFDY